MFTKGDDVAEIVVISDVEQANRYLDGGYVLLTVEQYTSGKKFVREGKPPQFWVKKGLSIALGRPKGVERLPDAEPDPVAASQG